MDAPPTVSVVVTAYNYGRYIEEALGSALAQTYRDFEIIVVDDGSTDDTRRRVAALGARIRYLYQRNAGMPAAQNTGILASRGEFIAFLDADDVWLPRKLERQVEAMRADPRAGVVYSWWAYMDQDGAALPQVKRPTHGGRVFEELLRGCFVTFSMALIRRECFRRVGLFDPEIRRANDQDMWLRITAAGYTFACVPEVLVRNRLHADHLSGDLVKTVRDRRLVLRRALRGLAPDSRRAALRRVAYRNLYVSAAASAAVKGDTEAAHAWLGRGVRLQPWVLGRPGFYLGLAFGLLPPGCQTRDVLLERLDAVAADLTGLLGRVLAAPQQASAITARRRLARSSLLVTLAALYAARGRWLRTVALLVRAVAAHPLPVVVGAASALNGRLRSARAALEG